MKSAQHSIEMRDKVILALGGSYNFSYYIDLEENTYSEIIFAEAAHNITGSSGICSETIGESFLRSVSEESKDKMIVFADMKTVSDRLFGKKIISCDYLNSAGKWCRISYVSAERNADGKVTKLIFVGQDIDDERKVELSKQQRLADGFEASEKIRAAGRYDTSHMPIIAMTANAFMEDVEKCRRSGMNDHIPKPIDITKALKAIAYHVRIYRAEKPKLPQL